MREVVNAENPFPLLRYHGQPRDERVPFRLARVLGDTTLEACDEIREAIIRERRMAAGGADNSSRDDLDDVGEVDPEAQVRPDTPAWKIHNMPTVHRGDEFWLAQDISESDTVDILVPGYGFCTIGRDKVELIEPTSAQNAPREPSIRRFMIENQEMDSIPATVYKAPLTMRHMTAFLSTLHQAMPPEANSSSSAKQQLDSFSLSRIFQFAAEATQRRMIIRGGRVYDNSSSGDDDNGNA